jgi:hypothetical protein
MPFLCIVIPMTVVGECNYSYLHVIMFLYLNHDTHVLNGVGNALGNEGVGVVAAWTQYLHAITTLSLDGLLRSGRSL